MSEEREQYERLCDLRGFKVTGKTKLPSIDPSFVMEYSYKDDTRTSMTIRISSETEIPDEIAEKVFELMTSKTKKP